MHTYRNAFRVAAVTVLPLTMLAISDRPAHAAPAPTQTQYGPPPVAPTVGCDEISFDPPSVPWITAGISGTVDGAPIVPLSASYGAPTPHLARFPHHLFDAPGPHPYDLHGTWSLGPGDGPHAVGTITCVDEPTTTTTSTTTVPATSTSVSTTSTSVTPTTSVSTSVPRPTDAPTTMLGIAADASSGTLPFTGDYTGQEIFGGCVALALGAFAASRRRNNNRAVARRRKLLDR